MSAKLKIALPIKLPPQLGAKLSAWWNGKEYSTHSDDEVLENVAQTNPENDGSNAVEAAVFEVTQGTSKVSNSSPDHLELIANEAIFGKGRTSPSTPDFDDLITSDFELKKTDKLILFGAEAGAKCLNIAKHTGAKVDVFETNKILKNALDEAIKSSNFAKNISTQYYSGKPGEVPKNRGDNVLMHYQGTSTEKMENAIFCLSRILKPKGMAIWFDFFSRESHNLGSNGTGRSFVSLDEFRPLLNVAGLELVAEKECGADFLNMFYKYQRELREYWEDQQAYLIANGGAEAANIALNNIITWRARAEALKTGKLFMKKILIKCD